MPGLRRNDDRGGRFQYRPRTAEDVKEQTEQQGGNFDSIFKSNVDMFKAQDGENNLRFCPPTWPDARSYSYEIWVHYNVGPRGGTYLCPKLNLNKRCPICEAEADALQHGEKDDADQLKAKKRKVAWVIDRNSNSHWPCLWSFGWTLDRDIGALLTDRKRGKVLQIDNPDNGYDVAFQRQSAKDVKNTKYFGFVVDRESSPMLDDERDQDDVLDFLQNNPLPDMLKFYGTDYLEELVSGTAGEDNDDDDYNSNEEDDDMVARARSTRASGGGGRGRDADDAPRGRGREETRRGGRDREDPPEDRETRRGRGRDEDDAPRGRGRDRDDPPARGARDRDDPPARGARDRDDPPARGARDRDDAPRGRDRDDPPPRGARDRDDDRGGRSARGRDRDDPPADDADLPFDNDAYDENGDPENGDDAGADDRGDDRDADRPRTARGGGRGARNGDARGADDDRGGSRSSQRPPPREQGRRAAPRSRR